MDDKQAPGGTAALGEIPAGELIERYAVVVSDLDGVLEVHAPRVLPLGHSRLIHAESVCQLPLRLASLLAKRADVLAKSSAKWHGWQPSFRVVLQKD